MTVNQKPEWFNKGKSIRQLIQELQTFEDQDIEARISIDSGDTDHCISILVRQHEVHADGQKYRCVMMSCETPDDEKVDRTDAN